VSGNRAGTGLGAVPEPLLTEANRLVDNWLAFLEESGDRLLAQCTRPQLAEAVKHFIAYVQSGGDGEASPAGFEGGALATAARSLSRRLATRLEPPAHPQARRLLQRVCRHMLRAAGAGAQFPVTALEACPSVLAAASVAVQRATSGGSVKRTAVEAAAELGNADKSIWWDQQDGYLFTAAVVQGARLIGAKTLALPSTFWKTKLPREGEVVWLSRDQERHRELLDAVRADDGFVVRAGAGGRWIGALSVHGGDYTEGRLDLLVSLAQQAAAAGQALELAADKRHLSEVQHRSISELGFALSSALSLEELLQLICRSATELVEADDCLLYLAEPEDEFLLRANSDGDAASVETRSAIFRDLAEQARAQPMGRPLRRTGAGARGVGPAATQAGYRSALGLALAIRGDPLGSLLLLSRKPKAFSPTQREIMVAFAAQAAVAVENLQLVEDMQRRLLEMADLTWVSTRITSTMEVERIAATVANAASKALDTPRIAIFLLNEEGEYVPMVGGQRGLPSEKDEHLPPSGHLGHEALSVNVPQVVVDAAREGRQEDPLVRWLEVRSLLCVPMAAQQGLQGILVVGDERPRDFPSHAVALLSAYANQTALAMQSARLYQDALRHLKQLENLFEVSQTLASSLELMTTLDRVLSAAAELLDAPIGTLMLMDPDTEELVIKAARGIRPDHEFYRPVKSGEGLSGRAAQSGAALVSMDLPRDGRFSHRGQAREGGIQTAIAAPLVTRGHIVGVLNLYRQTAQPFDEEDKRLVMALANSAAVAIENARLYVETQERAQFLTAMVSEINHRVRNTLQAVAGLLRMEMEQQPPRPIEEVLRRGIARLQSVAVVHDMLQARDLRFVDIKQAARRIVQLTSQTAAPGNEIETRVSGARVMLPSQQAANVAMILSELVDNAVRHGLAQAPSPHIAVSLAEGGNSIVIEVSDNGVGLPPNFDLDADSGLGLKVVRGLVEEELGGNLEVESNKGVTVRAKFPKRQ